MRIKTIKVSPEDIYDGFYCKVLDLIQECREEFAATFDVNIACVNAVLKNCFNPETLEIAVWCDSHSVESVCFPAMGDDNDTSDYRRIDYEKWDEEKHRDIEFELVGKFLYPLWEKQSIREKGSTILSKRTDREALSLAEYYGFQTVDELLHKLLCDYRRVHSFSHVYLKGRTDKEELKQELIERLMQVRRETCSIAADRCHLAWAVLMAVDDPCTSEPSVRVWWEYIKEEERENRPGFRQIYVGFKSDEEVLNDYQRHLEIGIEIFLDEIIN